MQFGHFLYPMTLDASRDYEAIEESLAEAVLAEQLGFHAVWIAEHHFVGEAAYGDPLVFAAAVAVKTTRVLIGLGIVEMAIHNPVQLAIQTALLDNLSKGRLVVGTGRGSNFNAFEYIGFGTTVDEGQERLEEAEDLLVKAWTTDALDYHGKHWKVTFPAVRPRTYQSPHPPLARACISEESVMAMARIGRTVLFRGNSVEALRRAVVLYRDTMLSSGFSEEEVQTALDKSWVWREAHVAETDDQALEEFIPAYERAHGYMTDVRDRWNPPEHRMSRQGPPLPRSAYGPTPDPAANEVLIGSPKRVSEQVAMLRDAGACNLMLTNRGLMNVEKTKLSMKLLSEQVIPAFK